MGKDSPEQVAAFGETDWVKALLIENACPEFT